MPRRLVEHVRAADQEVRQGQGHLPLYGVDQLGADCGCPGGDGEAELGVSRGKTRDRRRLAAVPAHQPPRGR